MSIYPSGTIINNRYEVVQGPIEKPSLAGGMGLVYLCVDLEEDGKPVALKTFRPELLSNRAARDRFLREGTTWVELGVHPNIVRCYNVLRNDVSLEVFVVIELVAAAEGKKDASLRSWLISERQLDKKLALLFGLHIARGMKHATKKITSLVHRDLKPENVLVGRDGIARVTDFGLASIGAITGDDWHLETSEMSNKIRTKITQGIAGTPQYMPPEQWKGELLDARTDIYAFGCILYEMVAGRMAIDCKEMDEIEKAHCKGIAMQKVADFPEPWYKLLERCVMINREDRYSNWVEVESILVDLYEVIFGKKVSVLVGNEKVICSEMISAGWSYNAIGASYLDISKFNVARDYFERVLYIGQAEGNCHLEKTALGNLGLVYSNLGDFRRAIKFYEQDLAISHEIGDRHSKGQALGNLGNAYKNLGDIAQSVKYYKQCLAIACEIRDIQMEGATMGNLGTVYCDWGEPCRAIEFHEKHLECARKIGDRQGEGIALGNLGLAYTNLGDFHRAIEFYEQDLTIAREIGDREGEGRTLCNLGIAYRKLGDLHQAIKCYKENLAIAREIGDRHAEGKALGNLGIAYKKLGHTRLAIEFYEECLDISQDIGDMMDVAISRYNLALLLLQDQPNDALFHAENAAKIFEQIDHQQYASKVNDLINKINFFVYHN